MASGVADSDIGVSCGDNSELISMVNFRGKSELGEASSRIRAQWGRLISVLCVFCLHKRPRCVEWVRYLLP